MTNPVSAERKWTADDVRDTSKLLKSAYGGSVNRGVLIAMLDAYADLLAQQSTPAVSAEERAKLEALAKAATPGPWTWRPQEEEQERDGTVQKVTAAQIDAIFTFDTGEGYLGLEDHNAAFIAACSPDVILRLLAQLSLIQSAMACHLIQCPQAHQVALKAALSDITVEAVVDEIDAIRDRAIREEWADGETLPLLRDALAQGPQASAWRPIRECQKDDFMPILLWWPERFNRAIVGRWDESRELFTADHDGQFNEIDSQPTHFQPLPAPTADPREE